LLDQRDRPATTQRPENALPLLYRFLRLTGGIELPALADGRDSLQQAAVEVVPGALAPFPFPNGSGPDRTPSRLTF
jgi:hypothetical protein